MASAFSDSEIHFTKSVTWEIRKQSNWNPTAPVLFDINKQECFLKVNFAHYRNYEYDVTISLSFTKDYTTSDPKFIVVLYFPKDAGLDTGYTFKLFPTDKNNIFHSSQGNARRINESTLGNSNCSITAVIFYQNSEYYEISSFVKDMKSILKSEIHPDFQIKANDKVFNVHKAVISARSIVFKKIIENNMLEKKSDQVELQADPIVVEALLNYVYTNSKCKVPIVPTELFKLAHFLEIQELQTHCKHYLLSNINLKNIISILELTSYDDYNLKDLHNAAMKFVEQNEKFLIMDLDFQEFLCNRIKLETITYILRLSYKYQIADCLEKAMEFIRIHHEEVLNDKEFEAYLNSKPCLCIKILRYCLNFINKPPEEK